MCVTLNLVNRYLKWVVTVGMTTGLGGGEFMHYQPCPRLHVPVLPIPPLLVAGNK